MPTAKYEPQLDATTATGASFPLVGSTEVAGEKANEVGRSVPAFVSKEQAYYWSHAWQAGEAEALHDLEAGEFVEFDDPKDAIRYLLAVDD